MIISKTPYRVDLIGDGTDIGSFCDRERGCIINASIKKYVYILVHSSKDKKIRVVCGDNVEIFENVESIKDGRVRECLKKVGIYEGVEIHSVSEAETGTGLGGSSSFTVGLLNALYKYSGQEVSREQLAKDACEIEIEILKEPIGRQDQHAAALGGFNRMDFIEKSVGVSKFIDEDLEKEIERKMMMFYLGGGHSATAILSEQSKEMRSNQKVFDAMRNMRDLADEIAFEAKRNKIENFGKILQKNWDIKKNLVAGINNPEVEKYYNLALEAGAEGAKLSGAGGTGFLLVYAEPEKQQKIREVLSDLEEHKFEFEKEGTKIVYSEENLLSKKGFLKKEIEEVHSQREENSIKGIAFDLEGTVVDLEPLHHSAHLEVFKKIGLDLDLQEAIEKIEHFIGGPDKAIMEDAHKLVISLEKSPSLSVEEMIQLDKEIYSKQLNELNKIPPREGFLKFLQEIKERKIPFSIASLTDLESAKIILEKSGLIDLFDHDKIIFKDFVINLKPFPDVYMTTAQRMGIDPKEQIVFEDSHNGVKAAISAGSKMVIGMPVYNFESIINKLIGAGVNKFFLDWREVNLKEIMN